MMWSKSEEKSQYLTTWEESSWVKCSFTETHWGAGTLTVYCQHNDSPCFYFDGRVSCVPVVLCVTDFSQLGGGSIQLLNTLWLFPPSLITVITVRGQNETMSDTNHQFRAEHWFCWCFHVAGGFLWDWETTCDTETQLKRHSVKQFNTFRRLVAQIIQNKQMKSKVNTVSNVLTEFYSHCSVAVLISDVWKQREDCGNSWNPFGSITEHFPKCCWLLTVPLNPIRNLQMTLKDQWWTPERTS